MSMSKFSNLKFLISGFAVLKIMLSTYINYHKSVIVVYSIFKTNIFSNALKEIPNSSSRSICSVRSLFLNDICPPRRGQETPPSFIFFFFAHTANNSPSGGHSSLTLFSLTLSISLALFLSASKKKRGCVR